MKPETVEAMWEFEQQCRFPAMSRNHMTEFLAALDQTEEMRALREDAERWRYVKETMLHQHSGPHCGWTTGQLFPGDCPDSAIDAARKEQK